MSAPQRMVRFLDKAGQLTWGQSKLNSSTATLITGCGPHRPGAARNTSLLLTDPPQEIEIGTVVCPVPVPPAVMCVGLNYKKHAAETGSPEPLNPVIFYKNPGAVAGPFDNIVVPSICKPDTELDYECELAVVIGARPVRGGAKTKLPL